MYAWRVGDRRRRMMTAERLGTNETKSGGHEEEYTEIYTVEGKQLLHLGDYAVSMDVAIRTVRDFDKKRTLNLESWT